MPLSNKIFLFFFICSSMPQLIAMEATSLDNSPLAKLNQEISRITVNNLVHIPEFVELLKCQEQLFSLQECFINKTISKEDYAQELQELDTILPNLVNKVFNLPEWKKYTELIGAYITYLIKQANQINPLEQKIKLLNSLYKNYSTIRQQCLWLENEVTIAYNTITTMPLGSTSSTKKKLHIISKEDFGYNSLCPDYSFVNILHNLCNALEEQQRLSEIIACMDYSLKNLTVKIHVYNDLADTALKGQKSIEGRYVGYMFSTLVHDDPTLEKLQSFALPWMNHANEEVKNIGRLIYAKNAFDRAINDYLQLEKIFLTIYAQSQLNALEELALADHMQHNLIRNFLPVPFFQFPYSLQRYNAHLMIDAKTLPKKIEALQVLSNLTKDFMQQFNEHKSEYTKNYKKLKDTLRNEIVKCPQSAIFAKRKYLIESLLSSYSLDNAFKDADLPHYSLVDKEQHQLLESIQKARKNELSQATPDLFVSPPHSTPQKQQPLKHTKKKRSRRKNQKRRQQNFENKEKEKESTANSPLSNATSISLGAKKIAKKILDTRNNATLYVYCTNGVDHTAGQHINYDDRVQKWFSKPEEALEEKNFASDDPRRLTSIPFHSFCRDVDKYALKWGFKKEALNMRGEPVTEIMLPCVFEKEGESTEGLCEYVIDKKMLCYHRFFKPSDWHKKIAQEWKIDFNE